MSLAPLRVAAAAYVLDAISNEELRQVADEALTRGVYTWSLGELGTTTDPSQFVVRPLFERTLKELGIPLPSLHEAFERLVTSQCRALIEGVAFPSLAARTIWEATDHFEQSSEWKCITDAEKEQLKTLVGCHYRFEEMDWIIAADLEPEYAASLRPQIEQDFRQNADKWVEERNRGRIDRSWLAWNDGGVRKMAQTIHDDRRFSDLPLLADALDDAGCCDVEILEHCREQAAHVSNCWVVQLLLATG